MAGAWSGGGAMAHRDRQGTVGSPRWLAAGAMARRWSRFLAASWLSGWTVARRLRLPSGAAVARRQSHGFLLGPDGSLIAAWPPPERWLPDCAIGARRARVVPRLRLGFRWDRLVL